MSDQANTPVANPYSWPQRLGAIAIAVVSDILNALFTWAPPVVIAIDMVTAILLWLVLGRPMLLLPVFVVEAIPGASVVPLWTLVAVGLACFGRIPGRGRVDGAPPTTSGPGTTADSSRTLP